MIYFTAYENFITCLAMLAFGALFPLAESALEASLKLIKSFPSFLKQAYNKKPVFSETAINFKAELKNKLALFFFDVSLVLLFFISFILLSYAFYDGILRIYFFAVALGARFISKKLFKKIDAHITSAISFVLWLFFLAISVLFIPVKVFLKIWRKLFLILYLPIERRVKLRCSSSLFKRKVKEIDLFLQKL